ncbi:MAG: transglycosylase domain-containing protein [Acidimicrobiales bacterium]
MRRVLALLVVVAAVSTVCSYQTKEFTFDVADLETAQSSRVFDRNGVLISELRGEQNRTDVTDIAIVPEVVRNAIVAIEDERFYDHNGVDLKAIIRAARSNVSAGGISEGGSTITQQYVGNVFLDRSVQDANRKIEEIFMALRFEQQFTKEFILLQYMNWVYFGNGAYGIEAAAREYFGAPSCARATTAGDPDDRDCYKVSELTVDQAALLAGLIQAPSRYDPYDADDDAIERRDQVLDRMLANGFITAEEHAEAIEAPIRLEADVPILEEQYPAAFFVEDVKQWFLDNPRFGATREERATLLFEGGLDIHTTVDLELQADSEAAVAAILPDNGTNPDAAAVVMGVGGDEDGHILAMVGGRDFFGSDDDAKFNLASGKGRQAGSSMKPIGLAAALQLGFSVTETYNAPPFIEIERPNVCGPRWRVRGGAGDAVVTLVRATRSSLNSVFAQLMVDLGPPRFVEMAEDLGIGEGRIAPVCAAILGTEDVNMVEMATVYSTFARSGLRVDPVMVTEIRKQDGTALYEHRTDPVRVLDVSVANQLAWVLSGVITGGTGTAANFGRPAAGKTGTAQNFADATFMGFTPQRATAVWVGFPDAQIPMVPPATSERVFGGTFPARIWREIMTAAHADLPVMEFPAPPPSSPPTTTEPPLPDAVAVPDLIGRVYDAEVLAAELEESTLVVVPVEVESNAFEPGTIVNQAPLPEVLVPGGATITVEVAVAPPEPDTVLTGVLVGLSEAQAKQVIAGDGLAVAVITEANPDTADDAVTAPGVVWQQDPAPSSEIDVAGTVTIWVNPIP